MPNKQRRWILAAAFVLLILPDSISAVDFLFNSFHPGDLLLVGDARVDSSVIRLTNDSNYYSTGRAFFPTPLNLSSNSSFSTSFAFSILPQNPTSPGFGLAFLLSNSTALPSALSGQYLGIFSNETRQLPGPLLAVEFDTGQNPEFNDPDGNHVGIDLNFVISDVTRTAPVAMNSGQNIRAWIELDAARRQLNVSVALATDPKPAKPLISYASPKMARYLSPEMFVGFSASKVKWVEAQRILAWSLSDTGGVARDLNVSNLPLFSRPNSASNNSSLSKGAIAGISCAAISVLSFAAGVCYYRFCCKRRKTQEESDDEEWELKYWPRRFLYEDLEAATDGFSRDRLLGFGGFGKVYRGVLESSEVAVKCVSHESKQGLREFMAEISSMGRLEHKNLVQLRGWCRKGNELILVYEYMPNGNLSRWIFRERLEETLGWAERRRVLLDVAEGLLYLHEGWEQVVLHRDIKCTNVLLDGEMRGRLGDFGLAKLYQRGEKPGSTRVVGTFGYLAPELGVDGAPAVASDVYSFGVVALEVATGRRAIERMEEEDWVLVEWVTELYEEGRLGEARDGRLGVEGDVELVLKLGLACCHPEPEKRPTMREVVAMLAGGSRGDGNSSS